MAVDGYLNFNTKINTSGFDSGTSKISAKARSTASEVMTTASKTDSKIQAILNDSERTIKSKAASIAAIYRKEGMDISEAMEKAWSHIERGSAKSASVVSTNAKRMGISLLGLKQLLSKLAIAASAAFAVRGLVNFGKQAIETASDIQEVQNVVDVSFGELTYQMEEFADKAIETYGISKLTAKQTGSTYMAMAKGMGIANQSASEMALTLTGLSADMASFYNKEQSVTSTALNSIFTGETETLKQFGIVMTEANLQSFAYTQGINKKISAMSQAEKVQLRYNYVLQQTALVQGDFVRTQDGWANQTRILSEQWKEFSGTVGTIFMNTLLPAVQELNKAMTWLNGVARSVLETLAAVFDWDIETNATGSIQGVGDAISGVVDEQTALNQATEEYKNQLMGFDKINKLSDDSATAGASTTGAVNGNSMTATMKLDADTSEAEKELTGFAGRIKEAWESGDYAGLGALFAEKVNVTLNNFANGIDWNGTKEKIQSKISGVAEGINSFVDEVDWSLLSQGISESISVGITTVDITLDSLDFNIVGSAIGEFINGIDIELLAGDLGSLLSTVVSSAFDSVSGFLQEFDFRGLVTDYYEAIQNFVASIDWNEVASSIFEFIGSALGSVLSYNVGVLEYMNKIWSDIIDAFKQVGEYFNEQIEEAGGNIILGVWNGITNAHSNVWTWISENIFKPFIEGFKKAFGIASHAKEMEPLGEYIVEGLKEGIGDVWEKVKQKFIDMLAKIKDFFKTKKADLEESWSNFTSVVKDKTANMRAKVKTKVKTIKDDWSALVGRVKDKTANMRAKVKTKVKTVKDGWKSLTSCVKDKTANMRISFSQKAEDITKAAKKRYNAVTEVFKDIPDWFKDKFSTAWDKVRAVFSSGGEVFSGIKDGILQGLKNVINALIDGINKVIATPFNGLNAALEKIKNISIAGSQPFYNKINTISVPQIPKLATGTVVPANYGEFLAILGDNKRETEVVSPLSTIKKAVSEVLSSFGREDINLNVYLDGKVIYKDVVKRNKQNTKITGVNALA